MSPTYRWITATDDLEQYVDGLLSADRYALDTEFHRERTYFPRLALVQLAWEGDLVLVDPLAVDIRPLGEILDGPTTVVLHASGQDLEVLERLMRVNYLGAAWLAAAALPGRIFAKPQSITSTSPNSPTMMLSGFRSR